MNMKLIKTIVIVIVINIGVLGGSLLLYTLLKGRESRRENPYEYTEADEFKKTPRKLLTYRETGSIPLSGEVFNGLAVSPDGSLYVTTGSSLLEIDEAGLASAVLSFENQPGPVCVDEKYIYLAVSGRIEIYDKKDYSLIYTSAKIQGDALITSVIYTGGYLVVSDARGKLIFFLDKDTNPGQIVSSMDDKFIVPSPHFDAAEGAQKDTFWAVNPGRHSLTLYEIGGRIIESWEASSFAIEGFSGCCNPVHIGLTPDGLLVTAEKGIPRVKVYSPEGSFLGVVAGSEQFEEDAPIADLAVDPGGRVLVLDKVRKAVRIFVKK